MYMEIKFISDGKLLLNKTIEIPSMIIVVTATLYKNNKYYPQAFSDEYFYKTYKWKVKMN